MTDVIKKLLSFFVIVGALFIEGVGLGIYIGERRCQKTVVEKDEMIRFRTHHAVILEDIINDVYEHDSAYFHQNIATSAPFDSLRSLYKDEFKRDPKQITWEDMYNY